MKIRNRFDLFVYASIDDRRLDRGSSRPVPNLFSSRCFFDRLERRSDAFLQETRYWLNGGRIVLYDNELLLPLELPPTKYASTLLKAKSLAKAIFFFTPGIALQAALWVFDSSYIERRNKHILQILNEQKSFDLSPLSSKPIKRKKVKKGRLIAQNGSSFCQKLPKELQWKILSLLNPVDLAHAAQTCKENYALAAEIAASLFYRLKRYPSALAQAIGNKLDACPFVSLPPSWQRLFQQAQENQKFLEEENFKTTISEIDALLLCQTFRNQEEAEKEIDSIMKNASIARVQLRKGRGLLIRIKDNTASYGAVQTIALIQMRGKWTVATRYLSPGLWLLFNDLRFQEKTPKALDYLTRLFKGEPCGNFSNETNEGLTIDYKAQQAGETLEEGPRVCADGKTPVVRLLYPF